MSSISVVVTVDYEPATSVAAAQLRACLAALAAQDIDEPFEVVFVEEKRYANWIPADALDQVADLRTVLSEEQSAYRLILDGVRAARGDIVAAIDGDCVADPGWLRHATAALRAHPEWGAVSGRTTYPPGAVRRCLALLARSFTEQTDPETTPFVTNNNAAYRRDAFLAVPLPSDIGPFGAGLQARLLRDKGYAVGYEPGMRVVHDHVGWRFEHDSHDHIGFGTIRERQLDPAMSRAWITRLGLAGVPLIVGGRIVRAWQRCLRGMGAYGVRWFELPLAFALAVGVALLEVPGMVRALTGGSPPVTRFR